MTTETIYHNDDRYNTTYTESVRPNYGKHGRPQGGYPGNSPYGYGGGYGNGNMYQNEYPDYNYYTTNRQKKSNDMNVLLLSIGVIIIGLQVINLVLNVVSLF